MPSPQSSGDVADTRAKVPPAARVRFNQLRGRWRDQIVHDARLTPRTRLVGYEIARHLNPATGDAWPSQETIRKNLGFKNISQVKRGITDLKSYGYIEIVFNSRSRSNRYVPRFNVIDRGPGATIDSGENATRWGLNNSGDSGASAPQSSKGNLTEPVAKSDSLAVSPDDGRWLLVKNRLASVLGTGIVASWFEGLQLQRLTLTEVVMTAPSKFVKQYIENGYLGDRLLDAWRSQVPLIERVSLVVAVGSTVVV